MVINLLKERGDFVKSEKWANLKTINEKIHKSIKEQKTLDQMQRPCSVFATFESEEGYMRATKYNELVDRKTV